MSANIGFVYILGNEYMPKLFKVGCTERSPRARADEISNATGVPAPFQVLCYAEFESFQNVERGAHEWLEGHRVNPSREFFHDCLREAVSFLWFHPQRIAFTDATAGSGWVGDSELVCMTCTEEHEHYLDDLPNPWAKDKKADAERIERAKRYARGEFLAGDEDDIALAGAPSIAPELGGEPAVPAEPKSVELKLVTGGAA